MWKYVSLLIAAVAVIVVASIWNRNRPGEPAVPHSGAVPAPAWTLKDLDGQPVSSAQFRGKVVILDFWATWCPPCRAEIPGFVELQKTYGDQGLVVVGVSLDRTGPAPVKEFVQRFNMNYPVVMGDEKMVQAFGGIEALPTTFIINRAGHLTGMHVGFTDKQAFEKEIKPLL